MRSSSTPAIPTRASTCFTAPGTYAWCFQGRQSPTLRGHACCSRRVFRLVTTSLAPMSAWSCFSELTPARAAPTRASPPTTRLRWRASDTRTSRGPTTHRFRNAPRSKSLVCFFNDKVDKLWVDDESQERPETHWA